MRVEVENVLELGRRLRVFFEVRLGAGREDVRSRRETALVRQVEELREAARSRYVRQEDILWVFGTARVGSTWMASMLSESFAVWHEPLLGHLFGHHHYERAPHRTDRHGILGDPPAIRRQVVREFVARSARLRFPAHRPGETLVVKEPNGSIGAPLLSEAMPQSRLICMVRDPRDIAASGMDAHRGWRAEQKRRAGIAGSTKTDPLTLARSHAERIALYLSRSVEAYDAHAGPKSLVRYEDLRASTLPQMRRACEQTGTPFPEEDLARAVKRHAFESIPEEKRGAGKFYRKATPGGWREDLTPEQARIVEEVCAPLLERFYS